MLYKDLEDCEQCPLKINGVCPGGWTSGPGGDPIEPPCTRFEPDDDLDIERDRIEAQGLAYEREMEQKWLAEQEKIKKWEVANKRRQEARWHVRAEDREIRSLRKRISGNEAVLRLAETFAAVNEMMDGRKREVPKDGPVTRENAVYRERIKVLEAIKRRKLAELRKQRAEAGV